MVEYYSQSGWKEHVLMEVEIKLAPVLPHIAGEVFNDSALAPYLGGERRIKMRAEYFDNEEGLLSKAGYTLRMRREDDIYVCALKGRADDSGARPEFEARAEILAEGVKALLAGKEVPAEAADILRRGGFKAVCGANYIRRVATYRREGLVFELCFDEGQAQRGVSYGSISEMELELVQGDAAGMKAVAEYICKKYGLDIGKKSKQQQAMDACKYDKSRPVSPFFVASELLNFCIKSGWLALEMDEEKKLNYYLTESGESELPTRFGVNFSKPCAFAGEGGDDA